MNIRDRASIRSAYILAALIVAVPCFPAQAQGPASKVAAATQPQTPGQTEIKPQAQAQPQAQDSKDGFLGPHFRKGLWLFKRTLDVVRNANKNVKYRVADSEVTRCVDPTHSMKATFSPEPVGSCVSDKPEKVGNKYTFGKRCDYLGAVSTVITVYDDESYTEINEINGGEAPKTDFVTAKRIGDCGDDKAAEPVTGSVTSPQPGVRSTSLSH